MYHRVSAYPGILQLDYWVWMADQEHRCLIYGSTNAASKSPRWISVAGILLLAGEGGGPVWCDAGARTADLLGINLVVCRIGPPPAILSTRKNQWLYHAGDFSSWSHTSPSWWFYCLARQLCFPRSSTNLWCKSYGAEIWMFWTALFSGHVSSSSWNRYSSHAMMNFCRNLSICRQHHNSYFRNRPCTLHWASSVSANSRLGTIDSRYISAFCRFYSVVQSFLVIRNESICQVTSAQLKKNYRLGSIISARSHKPRHSIIHVIKTYCISTQCHFPPLLFFSDFEKADIFR